MTVTTLNGDIGNAAAALIDLEKPYAAEVTITGTSALLFHRWQTDSVEAKSRAAKGSAAKKTDDVESYIWRDHDQSICLPGHYLVGSLIDPKNGAAKYRQDPRSPRKSALDLYRACVVALTDLAPIRPAAGGETTRVWDYIDQRRVTVQRNGVTRQRPAFLAGWETRIVLQVLQPQYVPADALHSCLVDAGRLVGVGDFRPTFGRFAVTRFDLLAE